MKKFFVILLCGFLLCGCGKKDQNDSVAPTPTPDADLSEKTYAALSEFLPESVSEMTILVETSVETIEIQFKEEGIHDVLSEMNKMKVSEEFEPKEGSGALTYRLLLADEEGKNYELTEQGNILKLADGLKVGPESNEGVLHTFVRQMDWVVEISSFEVLTPLSIDTDAYSIQCKKGKTSSYDLTYLKDIGFDPFEHGFRVVVDGSDLVLAEMPEEGEYLLILTKDQFSYQLKVSTTMK